MSRRYLPDTDAITAALARRVDAMEREVRETGDDVTALGRGVADLTAEIRRLAADSTTTADPGEPADDAPEGQPDWLAADDVETARLWLCDVQEWATQVLPGHGITVSAPCWPLHPDVVALLLALQTERDAAYAGDRPTPVTEWLTRWLPTTAARLDAALAPCVSERGHVEAGAVYDASALDLAAVAAWWVTDRDAAAPAAFALTRLS